MASTPDSGDLGADDLVVEGISKSFDQVTAVLDGVDLVVPAGTSLALLGPSGCGKTTLLRIIAGLEQAGAGVVRVGERVLCDTTTSVSPDKRKVGMVFQDWALFTHLDVARNVGFGLPRPQRRRSPRIDAALAMVGMAEYSERSVTTLSGGQQQRVALARALAPRPDVLLLDEPFSNLDATLRSSLRREVRQLLGELGITSVFVTHDQEEAFIVGDTIAVMDDGQMIQVGRPVDIYERPVNPWVAEFVGEANFIDGHIVDDATTDSDSGQRVAQTVLGRAHVAFADEMPVAERGCADDAKVDTERSSSEPLSVEPHGGPDCRVLVRPEQILISDAESAVPQESIAIVESIEYLGQATRYRLDLNGLILTAHESGRPRYSTGGRVIVGLVSGVFAAFEPSVDR